MFEHFTWDGKTCGTIGSFEVGGVRWRDSIVLSELSCGLNGINQPVESKTVLLSSLRQREAVTGHVGEGIHSKRTAKLERYEVPMFRSCEVDSG